MQRDSMADDWLARLKGHADLVQRLVKEIPKALEKPGLTLEYRACMPLFKKVPGTSTSWSES